MTLNSKFSRKKTNDFFSKFLDVLNAFCIKHRFVILKSDRQSSWKLFGIHPRGGHIYIDIIYLGGEKVNIGVTKNILDYENQKMYSKNKRIFEGDVSLQNIEKKLLEAMHTLAAWKIDDYDDEIEFPEWKKYKNKHEWMKFYKLDLPPSKI